MTGQLASPANWPPQPERSTPRRGADGLPAESGAHGARPAARAVAGIMLCLCRVRMPGTQLVTPDAASNGLQGWDMLQGTVLLRGWTVSDASPLHHGTPRAPRRGNGPGPGPLMCCMWRQRSHTRCWCSQLTTRHCLPGVICRRPAWLPRPPWPALTIPAARRHNVPSGVSVSQPSSAVIPPIGRISRVAPCTVRHCRWSDPLPVHAAEPTARLGHATT